MAGAGGFEPPHGGTKNRCLTAWRRPNAACLLERGGQARNIRSAEITGCLIAAAPVSPFFRRLRFPAACLLRTTERLAISRPPVDRSVAQPGRAPRSGRGGRRFKSCHSDQNFPIYYDVRSAALRGLFLFSTEIPAVPRKIDAPFRRSSAPARPPAHSGRLPCIGRPSSA